MRPPRNVRLLSWFNFCLDFRPYAPIAVLYYSQVSGSFALGMSVFTASGLSQSLFEVPTGVLSDRVGRKWTVVCGAVASVCSLVCYALGSNLGYPILLIGGVCDGLARSFYSGNNEALLYDTLAEHNRQAEFQEYLGRTSSMYQLALAISAVIGSLIAALSFSVVLWLSVIPMVLALIVSLQFREPTVHARTNANVYAHLGTAFKNIVHNPRLRLLSLAQILSYSIGEASWQIRAVFVRTLWPVWALGIAQMIGNATASLGFFFAGRIIRRFGEFRLLLGGMTLSEAINLFGLLVPTVISPALMASNSIFFGINTTAMGGLLQREFSDEQRATMGSLNSFAGSIGFGICSLLLGALADRLGVTAALIIAAALMVIPIGLFGHVLRPRTLTPNTTSLKEA